MVSATLPLANAFAMLVLSALTVVVPQDKVVVCMLLDTTVTAVLVSVTLDGRMLSVTANQHALTTALVTVAVVAMESVLVLMASLAQLANARPVHRRVSLATTPSVAHVMVHVNANQATVVSIARKRTVCLPV